jgi:peptidoglycan/xylan/chitin deacetylase (PgdA/CDA1 family)
MTWTALAEAVSTGLVTIGSHTHSHAVMDKLAPDVADRELRVSAELISDRLGVAAEHFAYPKGVFGGAPNERRVARYYRSAALADCGVNMPGSTNPLRLDRTPIQRSDGMAFFRRKVSGGLRVEGELRTRLNRRRYGEART